MSKLLKKNTAFQFALSDGHIIEDTGLISLEESHRLWDKYMPEFLGWLENEEEPEMAIWIDMENDTDYHTKGKYLYFDHVLLKDGILYTRFYGE